MEQKIEKCVRLYMAITGAKRAMIIFNPSPQEAGWDAAVADFGVSGPVINDAFTSPTFAKTLGDALSRLEAVLMSEARRRIDKMQPDLT